MTTPTTAPDSTVAASPVVVIGAGPIGLAAAVHLLEQGLEPVVLERGGRAGAAVTEWGHVRLFSRWSELVDPAARRLLEPTGWAAPEAGRYPTGAEWVQLYLQPLADALGDRVHYGETVTGVARAGRDRVVDSGRDTQPFTVHVRDRSGQASRLHARAVVDASGTWTRPNPLGSDGYPADGEHDPAVAEHIAYRVPATTDPADVARYGGKRSAVVGSGHSALTALVALAALAEQTPGTTAVWVLRRGVVGNVYGGGDADQLPARGALGLRAKEAVAAGHIEVVTGFRTQAVEHAEAGPGALALVGEDGTRIEGLDEVIGLTGFRPDHSILSEVRLRLDSRLEAPVGLAPLIDPNVHSCGTVYPHGAAELAHDEQDLYVVGMKAYGRAPTFLALTGYEQVRSVAAALAGDHESAARLELTLPETGVCGGAGLFDDAEATKAGAQGGGCCDPAPVATVPAAASGLSLAGVSVRTAPQLIQIGTPAGSSGGCGSDGC
ncbi:NAD(P)-binding domain-containing protein [Intrasporangium sp. YIM S08009]|uniref:NAD(P)-binding domain-containing protein n=1 Tax=Intrasporangium zincisolvens TaxID=3080018 RepID=UPI002B0527A1|nr:NAD(P)-binding domain-containing protein [Intrasporangium sp. YIM S08009]